MYLVQASLGGNERRDVRLLERSGRCNDIACLDHTVGRLDAEAGTARQPFDAGDLDTAADWGVILSRVSLEIVGDLFLGNESVGIAGKIQVGEAVMPRRAVGDER